MKSFDEIKKLYQADDDANRTSLREYEQAKRYYHGLQLPADVAALMQQRDQVPVVENIYKMIVDKILGYKSESIQEVKLSGRQIEDKPLATLLNDLLKVFSQQESYDSEMVKRDKELILGMAVMQVWIKQDCDGDFHLDLENIPADSFIVDKYSVDKFAKDARRFHRILNMNADKAKLLFGKEVITTGTTEFYDDRVMIIETWIKEVCEFKNENGEIYEKEAFSRYLWNNDNQILSYEKAPFKTLESPFIVCKYQVDSDLKWYGLFRNIKSLQDYINLAENRMLNMLSSMKAFFEEGAVIDPDEFVQNASVDNAVVMVRDGALQSKKIEFINQQNNINVISQKVAEKRNLAKILSGLNDEALGFGASRQSGIAMQQRREVGLMGLGEFLKSSDEMDKMIFRKALNFIMHYFTKKQVFKIVDKKVGERYFAINDDADENSKIRVGKFDLIYKTQLKQFGREERFAHWAEIMKTLQQSRPDLAPALLPAMLKDTDSPVVNDIEDAINAADETAQQNAAQQQEIEKLQFDLQIAKLKAEIAETQAKARKYSEQAELTKSITAANKQQTTTDDLVDIFTDTKAQITQSKVNSQSDKTRTGRIKGVDLR